MSRRHPESSDLKHRAALKQRIIDLEGRTLEGWRELTADKNIPELEALRRALMDLLEMADPRRGRNLDALGNNQHEPLSPDGLSTSEGRATLAGRSKLPHLRRELKRLVYEIEDFRNPEMSRRPRTLRKRCPTDGCKTRGRFQPGHLQYCGHCGAQLIDGAA